MTVTVSATPCPAAVSSMPPATAAGALPLSVSATPNVQRVLQALHAHRTPGWMYAGHYLGLACTHTEGDKIHMDMEVGPHCLGTDGRVSMTALSILTDVGQAVAVRSRFGRTVRIATLSMRLSWGCLPSSGRVTAVAQLLLHPEGGAIHTGMTSVQVFTTDGTLCCTGEASFAVLDNRRGTAEHPLAQRSTLEGVLPLAVQSLDAREQVVWHAACAAAQPEAARLGFEAAFYGIAPEADPAKLGHAQCRVHRALHLGNRVGHIQGGVLLGTACDTVKAAMGPGWQLRDISAQFVEAASEDYVDAQAQPLRLGRNASFVECQLRSPEGRTVLCAQANFVREAQAGDSPA